MVELQVHWIFIQHTEMFLREHSVTVYLRYLKTCNSFGDNVKHLPAGVLDLHNVLSQQKQTIACIILGNHFTMC